MKNYYKLFAALVAFGSIEFSNAQPVPPPPNSSSSSVSPGNCNCWATIDSTFSYVPFAWGVPPFYSNDDGSTPAIALPFTFCYYGSNYDTLYINNNGNITFNNPSSNFTPQGFPDNQFNMIAPFWGDVQTLNGVGKVRYKITPSAMIVQWDSVRKFPFSASTLENSFQLIITNGLDSLVPGGNNVAFCYQDISWFSGAMGSTVGVNKGDSVNYFQVTRAGASGNSYDGPYGNADGIDFLDNNSFYFSTCGTANNVPPISLTNICDSVFLGADDSTVVEFVFIGPEPGQIVTAQMAPNPNATVISSTSGVIATLTVQINGNSNRESINNIVVTATDNLGATTIQSSSVINPIITSVKNLTDESLQIIPNPSSGIFNITSKNYSGIVKVFNLVGEEVNSFQIQQNKNTTIDLTNQSKGIYFIAFNNGKTISTKKVIIE